MPVLILTVATVSGFFGRTLEDGVYFRAFGPVIYVVFYGGLIYAFYEFTKILRRRSRYVTYQDGYIHVLEQRPIKLDSIRTVTIEQKLFVKSLVIGTSGGRKTRIRGYLLQSDLNEVKNSIEVLQASERP